MKKIKSFLLLNSLILLTSSSLLHAAKSPIYPPNAGPSIGTDSPAIKSGDLVFISGIGAGEVKDNKDKAAQIATAFSKLAVAAQAAGGSVNDIVKLTVFMTDLSDYAALNEAMKHFFIKPYPARSTLQVVALPAGHRIEVEAVMRLEKKTSNFSRE